MALKQIRRPLGPEPSWANDALIVDPAKPWDATPTKVEPGAGKRDTGYLPEDNPTAQELNQKLNELGKWIQYFSSIQMMNWWVTEPRDIAAAQINTCECVTHDLGALAWIVGGRSDEVSVTRAFAAGTSELSPASGLDWQELGPTGDAKTWTWAASKNPFAAPTHTGASTVLSHSLPSATCNVAEFTGSWNLYSVPGTGTTGIEQHVHETTNQRWIFVGVTNAAVTPQPAIWTQVAPIGGALTPRAAPAVNSTKCECVAHNSAGLSVVAGDGAPFDVWTSSDAVTFARATPTGIVGGEEARALMWDPSRAVFVLLTDKSCYTSTDGVAWANLVTYTTDFAYRCLETDAQGGVYVACNESSSPRAVRYSTDGGVTWRLKPIPATDGPGGVTTQPRQIAYSLNEGQFAIANHDNPNQGCVTFSLGVGEGLFDPDNVLSFPTVT